MYCFQAIHLLPANTQIREIRVFLESVLEERAQRKRFDQVLKSLLQAEFLRVSPGQCWERCFKEVIGYSYSLLVPKSN